MQITANMTRLPYPTLGGAPAPSSAAATPATDPQDQVSPSVPVAAPVPSTNPWPAIERAGLLGAARATPGPLGQALGQVGREGLLDALTRLQANGVGFERERSWLRVPFTAKYVPLTPQETLDRLENDGTKRLNFNHAGQTHTPVGGLGDLRDLDATSGLGPDAAPLEARPGLLALADLRAAGWKSTVQQYYDKSDTTTFAAWRGLRGGQGQVQFTRPDGKTMGLSSMDDAVNVACLHLGVDHGVKNRPVLDGVVGMQKLGIEFQGDQYYGDPTLKAIHTLSDGGEVRVGLPKSGFSLKMGPADLKTPDLVKSKLEASKALWDKYFGSVLGNYDQYNGAGLLDFCQASDARFGNEMRAAVAGAVAQVVGRSDLRDGNVEKATRRMENLATDDLQLAWIANRFSTTARHEGLQGAMSLLTAMDEGVKGRTATRAEAERLRPVLYQMIGATGSMEAASEGIDLVRIAVGSESEEQRVGLFLDIAAHESEKTLDRTASDYRAVLVNRRPDEDLASAGRSFVNVLQILSLGRQQERAAEVFATLQEGLKQGTYGSRTTEEVLADLGQALTLGRPLDDAMAGLRGHGRSGGVPAGPSTVKQEDDTVVIGGVRVPRTRTS